MLCGEEIHPQCRFFLENRVSELQIAAFDKNWRLKNKCKCEIQPAFGEIADRNNSHVAEGVR